MGVEEVGCRISIAGDLIVANGEEVKNSEAAKQEACGRERESAKANMAQRFSHSHFQPV